jgi:hypothetical protein
VTWFAADPSGGHAATMEALLGTPVARLPLHGGIQLCCDRDVLLFGLALARRALAVSLAEPWRSESPFHFDRSEPAFGPEDWPVSGDFLLARATADGGLVDLTGSDVRLWMFWLGLDYVMNR